jgi:MFS family permease
MLPLFGTLSDKCNTKFGKRTPFITIGSIVAAVALVGLSFVDNAQLKNIADVSAIDDPASLAVIYDAQSEVSLITPEGEAFVLSDVFTKEDFTQIRSKVIDLETGKEVTNADYTNFVAPARQAYAANKTAENSGPLSCFVLLLLIILVAMATFRSPAVALMPDVTVKPLRSKANAIINLMGTAGGILVLVLGMVFSTSAVKNSMMSYTVFYGVVAAIMLGALTVFLATVREKKWAKQMHDDSIRFGIEEETEDLGEKRGLSKGEMRSLILILLSIALWYFGYNAVTSKYSVYAGNILHKDYNTTLLLAQAAAIVAYLPAGIVASKIGRKKTILAGVVMLTAAFGFAGIMRAESPTWLMNLLFALAGIAWATINVNSFPMVVEMCSGADIGKYTGFYYTASMTAQIVTPMLSGFLMDSFGMTVLFPYAAVFVALAFVTMFLVKHGDAKVEAKQGLEAFDTDD